MRFSASRRGRALFLRIGIAWVIALQPGLSQSAWAGNFSITPSFDLPNSTDPNVSWVNSYPGVSAISADPNASAIEAGINAAIQNYQTHLASPINVNITFVKLSSGLGGSALPYYAAGSYQDIYAALAGAARSPTDFTAVASLPFDGNNPNNPNPVTGLTTTNVGISLPNARALGFTDLTPPDTVPDGVIFLNTAIMNLDRTNINPSKYDLQAVVSHEIDEVLGFGSDLNGLGNGAPAPTGEVWIEDLFRYAVPNLRSFDTNYDTQSYFSIDSGATSLARFNQFHIGDYSDWYSISAHTPRVQDAFATPGATPDPNVEFTALDAIGYDLTPVPEPSSWLLLASGALGAIFIRRSHRSRASNGPRLTSPGNTTV